MVEVLIERDEEGRVQVVTLYGDDSPEGLAAAMLVEAPVLGMKHYLHLDPEVSREGSVLRYRVDRSDIFLDRELDAILETMVLGCAPWPRTARARWRSGRWGLMSSFRR